MVLCEACEKIPFFDLPPFPNHLTQVLPVTCDKLTVYLQSMKPQDSEPIWLPHHKSLDSLRAAAQSCELCSIIEPTVTDTFEKFNYLKSPKHEDYAIEGKYLEPYGAISGELLICKRPENVDGFAVLSPATENKEFFLVAAVGFCVENDSPLASVFGGRRIDADPKSSLTLERIRGWVRSCIEDHDHKRSGDAEVVLPARVIDVADPLLGDDQVRLRENDGDLGKYITLSHCWGSSRQFMTTKATFHERTAGIGLSELPQTFQDAIFVTRALGYRFIWIDSICICQDDKKDWERESANMAAVYSNAALSISAKRSGDDSAGFLSHREREYVPLEYSSDTKSGIVLAFPVPIRIAANPFELVSLPEEPLSNRGWALQERELSPRSLLYTSQQASFECKTNFRTEDGYAYPHTRDYVGTNKPGYIKPEIAELKKSDNPHDRSFARYYSRAYTGWKDLVSQFSARKLTKSIDKFPALAGVARAVDEEVHGKRSETPMYLAGLWRDDIMEDLCWQIIGGRGIRQTYYRAPSWSWAALDGELGTPSLGRYKDLAEFEDAHVEINGDNPYGEVSDGWIQLKAPKIRLTLVERSRRYEDDPRTTDVYFKMEGYEDKEPAWIVFDVKSECLDDELEKRELYWMPLAYDLCTKKDKGGCVLQGLVIEPCDPGDRKWVSGTVYKRVAWRGETMSVEDGENLLGQKVEGKFESITLI